MREMCIPEKNFFIEKYEYSKAKQNNHLILHCTKEDCIKKYQDLYR